MIAALALLVALVAVLLAFGSAAMREVRRLERVCNWYATTHEPAADAWKRAPMPHTRRAGLWGFLTGR